MARAGRRAARRSFGCGVAAAAAVLVFVVVTSIAAAIFVLSPGGTGASDAFLHAQPGSIRWNGQSPLTVLLLGTGGGKADAAAVAAYDPAHHTLSIVLLPANLWVAIPGFSDGRLSDAYADGGGPLADLTVESLLRVPIPYYAAINASTARSFLDALGGISLARRQHVDGAGALAAVSPPSPARQQRLLLALSSQVAQADTLARLPAALNTVGANIATNFPYDQVPQIARRLAAVPRRHITVSEIDPSTSTAIPYNAPGTNVLLPDAQAVGQLASQTLPRWRDTASVQVLNGAGIPGQAADLSGWLGRFGVRVRNYSSAASFNYARTHVVLDPRHTPEQATTARDLATLLHVPLMTGRTAGPCRVIIIIGRDYQILNSP